MDIFLNTELEIDLKLNSMLKINEAAKLHSEIQPYGVWKDDAIKSFKAGVEFAQRWISVEDELPEIGAEIVVKLKEHPLKKYQAWTIECKIDIEIIPVFATHWRLIELK